MVLGSNPSAPTNYGEYNMFFDWTFFIVFTFAVNSFFLSRSEMFKDISNNKCDKLSLNLLLLMQYLSIILLFMLIYYLHETYTFINYGFFN